MPSVVVRSGRHHFDRSARHHQSARTDLLHPSLDTVLRSLRSRIRRYVVCDSLLAIAALVLGAFWVGFLLDYGPVKIGGSEMPPAARGILLTLTLVGVATLLARSLVGRLVKRLPDKSLALLIEKHHPSVAGRLSTAVELNRDDRDRDGDSHSPALLAEVTGQAAAAMQQVRPDRVLDGQPLKRKGLLVIPMAAAALLLLIFAPATVSRAASRLTLLSNEPWPRRASLEMVGIELPQTRWTGQEETPMMSVEFDENKVARLPIGSSGVLRIRAKADQAEVPKVCTAYYTMADRSRGQTGLRRVGRVRDGYQSFVLDGAPLASLNQSVSLSIHGLDDALRDYEIIAVPPPAIDQTTIASRYPKYLRPAASAETGVSIDPSDDDRRDYQSGMRIREGSRVRVIAQSSVPVGSVRARLTQNGDSRQVDASVASDGLSASLSIDAFDVATTIELIPVDPNGISAQAPYRYFLGIVSDQAPEVSLKLSGIGSAITPMATLPMTLVATDDYGLKDASVAAIVQPPQNDEDENQNRNTNDDAGSPDSLEKEELDKEQPGDAPEMFSHTVRPSLDRSGTATFAMDFRQLELADQLPLPEVGSTVNLVAEAVDYYDIASPHAPRAEAIRLTVVTPDKLLSLLERTELELRARLEQTASEVRLLRDSLDAIRLDIGELDDQADNDQSDNDQADNEQSDNQDDGVDPRARQIVRLRVQQSGLQVNKTRDELIGVVATLGDLVDEMVNNRVDTPDRQDRLINQVAQPLQRIVDGSLLQLGQNVTSIESSLADPDRAAEAASGSVEATDRVIVELDRVLEKMLDLESFNELLDLVRGLIDDQEQLLEDTKVQRKQKVLDLFQ